jgi:tripartite-type tricarboxylate transporter receptor subunit TctC
MHRRDVLVLAGSSFAFPLTSMRPAKGQGGYPETRINYIVPRSAGGVVDLVARLWAERAKELLRQPVVVENQGGAGGMIAEIAVARAKPDGYTLLAGTTSELITGPVLSKSDHDPARELAPVAITALSISSIMVHASLPVTDIHQLIDYAKEHPGQLSYGSPGVGTSAQLGFELFKKLTGLNDIVHVPYKGANPGLVDFLAGRVPIFASSISPQTLQMQSEGKIRVLVAGSPRKLRGAPNIPISSEVGLPDLITVQFIGVFVPVATPRPVVERLASVCRDVMSDSAIQQKLIDAGMEPVTDSGPDQTAQFIEEDRKRWLPILKQVMTKTR